MRTYNCAECEKEDVGARGLFLESITYHGWARLDAYGNFTELCCDDCYDNGNYSFRKDDYFDEAYCGERLDSDY